MAMENYHEWVDAFNIEQGDFPASHVIFLRIVIANDLIFRIIQGRGKNRDQRDFIGFIVQHVAGFYQQDSF